jgi:hypothetical protein
MKFQKPSEMKAGIAQNYMNGKRVREMRAR